MTFVSIPEGIIMEMWSSIILLQLVEIHWILFKNILGAHNHANQYLPVPAGDSKKFYKHQMGFNSLVKHEILPEC